MPCVPSRTTLPAWPLPLPDSRASPVSRPRSGRPSGSPGRLPPERSPCSRGIPARRRASGALIGVSGERCRPRRHRLVLVSSFPRSSSRSTTVHRFPHQRRHVPIASFLGFVPQGPQHGGCGLSFFVPHFFMAALRSSCVPCFSAVPASPCPRKVRWPSSVQSSRSCATRASLCHGLDFSHDEPATARIARIRVPRREFVPGRGDRSDPGTGRPFVVLVLLVCPEDELCDGVRASGTSGPNVPCFVGRSDRGTSRRPRTSFPATAR